MKFSPEKRPRRGPLGCGRRRRCWRAVGMPSAAVHRPAGCSPEVRWRLRLPLVLRRIHLIWRSRGNLARRDAHRRRVTLIELRGRVAWTCGRVQAAIGRGLGVPRGTSFSCRGEVLDWRVSPPILQIALDRFCTGRVPRGVELPRSSARGGLRSLVLHWNELGAVCLLAWQILRAQRSWKGPELWVYMSDAQR